MRNSFFENSNGVSIALMEGEQATLSGNSIEGNDGPGIIASCMKGLSIVDNCKRRTLFARSTSDFPESSRRLSQISRTTTARSRTYSRARMHSRHGQPAAGTLPSRPMWC